MTEGESQILIPSHASVILDTLSFIGAGDKSEGHLIPGSRERLEAFARKRCSRLILEPGTAEELVSNSSLEHEGYNAERKPTEARGVFLKWMPETDWPRNPIDYSDRPYGRRNRKGMHQGAVGDYEF